MLGPLDVDLDHFGVSPKFGFLPEQYPLQALPAQCYSPWEVLIRQLPTLIKLRVIRRKIDLLPILSTEYLTTEREWQRAYVILSFFTHGYIWGGLVPSEVRLIIIS
jgi:indoleamine 2,3-dioxygenase